MKKIIPPILEDQKQQLSYYQRKKKGTYTKKREQITMRSKTNLEFSNKSEGIKSDDD